MKRWYIYYLYENSEGDQFYDSQIIKEGNKYFDIESFLKNNSEIVHVLFFNEVK